MPDTGGWEAHGDVMRQVRRIAAIPQSSGREEVHAQLLANAAKRDELRESILAAIRENRPEPPEAMQMRAVLADDERLSRIHLRYCRDVRECSL